VAMPFAFESEDGMTGKQAISFTVNVRSVTVKE
jgi:hypothetical protein